MKTWARALWLAPLPLALMLRALARAHPELAEAFAAHVYPALSRPLGLLASALPVPALGALAAAVLTLMAVWLAKRRFFRALAAAGLLAAVWLGGFGMNYLRLPLSETFALPVRPAEESELRALCASLAREIAEADAALAGMDAPSARAVLAAVPDAMAGAAARYPQLPGGVWAAPRAALTGPLWTRFLVEGVASPYTGEALVNAEIPRASLPYAACHEAAHARGFAREDDANFVAYLACRASDDAYLRYGGALSAFAYAVNALPEGDTRDACLSALPERARADLAAHAAFWAPYRETPAAAAGERVNDAYLQAVGRVETGARSYGQVVDLLLALRRAENDG